MFNDPKILIIGAGAAGFTAASRLLEKGFKNVTILEAKNRIGGRIHTTTFADNTVELGAQWVHGKKGNIVFDLTYPHDLLESPKYLRYDNFSFVDSQGELIPQNESTQILALYNNINDYIENDSKNITGSYGTYFINKFYEAYKMNPFTSNKRLEQFLEWIEKFDNSIQCSDSWFDVSAKGLSDYWICEGDSLLSWKTGGYKKLFDVLMRNFAKERYKLQVLNRIKFEKEVQLIDYKSVDKIVVTTTDGTKYKVSHVIFTPSLGVLKHQHSTMFSPMLPEIKQQSIEGLAIGSVNKFFLEFPHQWWPESLGCFCFLWSKNDKEKFITSHGKTSQWLCDVFFFLTVTYQPKVLCGWVAGQSARHSETLSDSVIMDKLYILLQIFLGKTYVIPKPNNIIRSKWFSDKHFRGCYSFRSMDSERMNVNAKDLAKPITLENGKPIILFAGEATHDHYYSTVHGAVESGFREADRLVNYYRQLKSQL